MTYLLDRPIAEAWAEITSLEHGHGGPGWELGRCLWSPTSSKDGADRYAIMSQPMVGDEVFHLVSGVPGEPPNRRFLYGLSKVQRQAVSGETKPPLPGTWSDAKSYFRIELVGFRELSAKLPMDEVEAGLAGLILFDLVKRPKYYPYAPYRDGFRGAQGIYLTKLSSGLTEAFRDLVGLGPPLDESDPSSRARDVAFEFAEGERSRQESSFFRRNPGLRIAAIRRLGLRCRHATWSLAKNTVQPVKAILKSII